MRFLFWVDQTFFFQLNARKFVNEDNSYFRKCRNQSLVVAFLFIYLIICIIFIKKVAKKK